MNRPSASDFIICQHRRVATPDRLFSVDWCPTDHEWVQAMGWPQLSRDVAAAAPVALALMERGLIEPNHTLSPHELCLRALEYILIGGN